MLISDIIPYERNARRNEKAVPKVAESIKEFGFKGSIVLRSHDDPTIVCGHTRVAACKSLGWAEMPDEYITWCDDLTDDEVKALRIADNKTGDIATYNKAMLREEVRSLKDFDMTRFGIDFKSKRLQYGAERLKTDRAYNLHLINRGGCGAGGFPALDGVDARPRELIGFNYAKSTGAEAKRGNGCHFFIDDYQFERVWASPEKYLDVLKPFGCVLTPDFSLYMDMPAPFHRRHLHRGGEGRCGRARGLDGRDARGDAAHRAVPRAAVRRRCGVRLRRCRGHLLQEYCDREDGTWAVEAEAA